MSAVMLYVTTAMIFQVTTFPLSINEINFDHFNYEPHNHKVFNNIKLKTLNTEKWV